MVLMSLIILQVVPLYHERKTMMDVRHLNGALGTALRLVVAWISGPGKIDGLEKRIDKVEAVVEKHADETATRGGKILEEVGSIKVAVARMEGTLTEHLRKK